MNPLRFTIRPAIGSADLTAARTLFLAYADSLPIDLSYQAFASELAGLPEAYAPPLGVLLLARGHDEAPLGCAALLAMPASEYGEMKRLYVSPNARGLGRGLALAIIERARVAGYRELRLDTLPSMAGAQALYRQLGFVPIAPYYDTPIVGTVFLALDLDTGATVGEVDRLP
jgi:ribosomal protein S18 acetylase RimI-like enzyme